MNLIIPAGCRGRWSWMRHNAHHVASIFFLSFFSFLHIHVGLLTTLLIDADCSIATRKAASVHRGIGSINNALGILLSLTHWCLQWGSSWILVSDSESKFCDIHSKTYCMCRGLHYHNIRSVEHIGDATWCVFIENESVATQNEVCPALGIPISKSDKAFIRILPHYQQTDADIKPCGSFVNQKRSQQSGPRAKADILKVSMRKWWLPHPGICLLNPYQFPRIWSKKKHGHGNNQTAAFAMVA
jgi:hypothetical protein